MPLNPPLQPIRIQIDSPNAVSYKSIDLIDWENVPGFAVLTGLNGSGKTQLLEVLAYRLTGTINSQYRTLNQMRVVTTGDTFTPDEVAFIPSYWQPGTSEPMNISAMQSAKQGLHQRLLQSNNQDDLQGQRLRDRVQKLLGGRPIEQLDPETFAKLLPDDFAFMLDESELTRGLRHVVVAYRLRAVEHIEAGTSRGEIEKILGPAPWDVLNETFKAADFPYRLVSPVGTRLLDPYEFVLEDLSTNRRIKPEDLSSGEKILLGLVLWLYNSQHHHRFPRLFLLDEPDAHLHPSMTRHLFSVLREVLVERYGVRIILTTHSPSTVAMAPEGSVFEMFRTAPRIRPSPSKAASIGLLTAGLVTVSPSTRYVLVEDSADVTFYGAVRDLLTDYGPSRDLMAIKPAPSIVFLPASNGNGQGKTGGGKSVVEAWVAKFNQAPLDELVRGVIDRDQGNSETGRVYTIGRYSIENYLLDPFVVFGVLLDAGTAPEVLGVSISTGDEHLLRYLPGKSLQSILDVVCRKAESVLLTAGHTVDRTTREVKFTNGKAANYPAWTIDFRGHDLLAIYQSFFGGPGTINSVRLEKSFRRVRLVPVELAGLMNKLQV